MGRYSALRIRVFDTCRLRYRYQYVDKVKPRLRPADTMGSLVHRVLCDFYVKVPAAERSREKLITMYEDGWRALSAGYHRIPGVEQFHGDGLRQLENYADRFDYLKEPFMVEPYLQVDIAPGITLFGRLDRIDQEPDGTLHIIDYKGGSLPGDIDPGQLVLYAVMAEAKLLWSVSRVSFWYLDDGAVWSQPLTDEDKERARDRLIATVHQMQETSDFPPTIDRHCAGCPFLYTCEVRDEIAARRQLEGW